MNLICGELFCGELPLWVIFMRRFVFSEQGEQPVNHPISIIFSSPFYYILAKFLEFPRFFSDMTVETLDIFAVFFAELFGTAILLFFGCKFSRNKRSVVGIELNVTVFLNHRHGCCIWFAWSANNGFDKFEFRSGGNDCSSGIWVCLRRPHQSNRHYCLLHLWAHFFICEYLV
jgi:hypothetical protein